MLCVIIILLCLWMQDHLHLMSSVHRVCLERFQTTVMLSSVNHTHSKMQMERKTHYLQIHAHAYGLFVFFSVRCEGRSVLRLGDSITDTLCEMTSPPSTTTTPLQISSKHPQAKQLTHMEETPHMNTTSTTSLPPPSSTAHSSSDSKDTIYYYIGKYEAMSLEFSLQPIEKYHSVTMLWRK